MGDNQENVDHEESNTADGQETEFEQLYNQSLKKFKSGTVVRGRVLQIRSGVVMLDVGYKSDGIIPVEQFTDEELKALKPGDELEVLLEQAEDSNGNIMLSRDKAKKLQVWDDLNKAYESGTLVKGKILAAIKGGLSVDIGGVAAFLPGSQIDVKPVHVMGQLVGRTMDLKIIKMNSGRGNIVLSRRVILEQQQNQKKEATLSSLAEGQIVSGVIKNITDYGAFVDLGGIDGLMHITDISWGRVNHPSEAFKVGDTIEVMVLKYDKEKQKVSLGLKQKSPDPWLSVTEKYPVGSRVKGKVMSLADYGAFVELEHGVEGLVHVSEMSWTQKIKHPSKVVSTGDLIEAQVLSIDPAAKRISLGMKQLAANPWSTIAERYPAGSEIEGKVKTVTDFGAFIGIEEGIDGLVHVSDLSWTKHIRHPSEILKKGQKTKAVVLGLDPSKERISLGIKQLTQDPWEQAIPERYKVGQDEKVKVTKKADFGMFVELEHGIEGLIPTSEVPKDSPEIKEGIEITARVIKVDKGDRKIALSIKAQVKGQDRSTLRDYMNQQEKPDTSIGALLKERS
jgi:small subunit ribosomal protein S1